MLVATFVIILSREQIIKALIRLRICAVWSAHLLFACKKIRISPDEASFKYYITFQLVIFWDHKHSPANTSMGLEVLRNWFFVQKKCSVRDSNCRRFVNLLNVSYSWWHNQPNNIWETLLTIKLSKVMNDWLIKWASTRKNLSSGFEMK